jgi:hypothetical protein
MLRPAGLRAGNPSSLSATRLTELDLPLDSSEAAQTAR